MRRYEKKQHIKALNERLNQKSLMESDYIHVGADKVNELGIVYAELAQQFGVRNIGTDGEGNPLTPEFVANKLADPTNYNVEAIECIQNNLESHLEDNTCSGSLSIGGIKFIVGEINNPEFFQVLTEKLNLGPNPLEEYEEDRNDYDYDQSELDHDKLFADGLNEGPEESFQYASKQIGSNVVSLRLISRNGENKDIKGEVVGIESHTASNGKPVMVVNFSNPFHNDMTGEETPNTAKLIVYHNPYEEAYEGSYAGNNVTVEPLDDNAQKWLYYCEAENDKHKREYGRSVDNRLANKAIFDISDGSTIQGKIELTKQGDVPVITVDTPNSNEKYYIYCQGDDVNTKVTFLVAGKKDGQNIVQYDNTSKPVLDVLKQEYLKTLGVQQEGVSKSLNVLSEETITMFDKLCGLRLNEESKRKYDEVDAAMAKLGIALTSTGTATHGVRVDGQVRVFRTSYEDAEMVAQKLSAILKDKSIKVVDLSQKTY